ncbi:hypothetical protein GCM10011396_52790 [Undibacterium terreum]|uniref:KAP NTPase domain-containing protein n=1 Tax=Undibacterium terreum TaxID=1224302 RepID=A0A916V214_9BURK|nr:hypothetical protein GCM10011396_52790 [Undibacterium terreum]
MIIDNIDRLASDEIEELFRVVKSVLDLSNIVYVLAYDRLVVSAALEKAHPGNGHTYLDKIVQMPYPMPKPQDHDFKKYLNRVIYELPMLLEHDGRSVKMTAEDKRRLDLLPLLVTVPRDAKRLKNALIVTHGKHVAGEIHPVDFILLKACELFAPNVAAELLSLKTRKILPSILKNYIDDNVDKYLKILEDRYPETAMWLSEDYKRLDLVPFLSSQPFNLFRHKFGLAQVAPEVNNLDTAWKNYGRITESTTIINYLQRTLAPGEARRRIVDGLLNSRELGDFATNFRGIQPEAFEQYLAKLYSTLATLTSTDRAQLNIKAILMGIGDCDSLLRRQAIRWGRMAQLNELVTKLVKVLFLETSEALSLAFALLDRQQLVYPIYELVREYDDKNKYFGLKQNAVREYVADVIQKMPTRLAYEIEIGSSAYKIASEMKKLDAANFNNRLIYKCVDEEYFIDLCVSYAEIIETQSSIPDDFLSTYEWIRVRVFSKLNGQESIEAPIKKSFQVIHKHLSVQKTLQLEGKTT